MKKFYGYIRVSTTKQGEHGVSLQEQQSAIERYAQKNDLKILQWFEERETAAKRGRPVFSQMLKLLRQDKAQGVIIHKIDRSARNLKDWADLGELIDSGIEVHFANESLDLHSRGGRLSADIQAVVAADYIRNLREETKKGFYGRLKQGLYPMPALLGYKDVGPGKAKIVDPNYAPLVRQAFELYASGRFNLEELAEELFRLGLRSHSGKRYHRNSVSVMLSNPFYMGLIRIKKTGETFLGQHEPLIPKSLFDRVQRLLKNKSHTKATTYEFLFRRLVRCEFCDAGLVAETHKDHTYYRCHTKSCSMSSVREELIEDGILNELDKLQFNDEEKNYFSERIKELKLQSDTNRQQLIQTFNIQAEQIKMRINRLTDAFLDQVIDKQTFEQRKTGLLEEGQAIEERLTNIKQNSLSIAERLSGFLELAGSASSLYKSANFYEKRDMVKILTSNRKASKKSVKVMLAIPFDEVANRYRSIPGGPIQTVHLVWNKLLAKLPELLIAHPVAR